jgi:hypothetical protein
LLLFNKAGENINPKLARRLRLGSNLHELEGLSTVIDALLLKQKKKTASYLINREDLFLTSISSRKTLTLTEINQT